MTKQMTPLRQRMLDDMAMRNMSPSTQKVYTYAVGNFAKYHRQSPDKLGLEHVRDYRMHLLARGLEAQSVHPSPPADRAEAVPVEVDIAAWMASSGPRPLRRPVATTERMSA